MARGGLPWLILAMDATADWEDKAGPKIKQTGKKNLSSVSKSSRLPRSSLPVLLCLQGLATEGVSLCQQRWAEEE